MKASKLKKITKTIIALTGISIWGATAQASELTLARIFSDEAVLQREMDVPVWGTATPGAEVVVVFAGQTVKAKAGTTGTWMVRLGPMQASSEGRVLTVRSHDESLAVQDVLVGDVWLCGGQSNMESSMSPFAGRPEKDPRKGKPKKKPGNVFHQAIFDGLQQTDTLFRQFVVDDTPSPFEKSRTINSERGWLRAVPGETEFFTQVGYFFGKELRRELNVPVGLIDCNHGGSPVEAWMPAEAFAEMEGGTAFYEKELNKWRGNVKRWNEEHGADLAEQKRVADSAYNNQWCPGTMYRGLVEPLIPYAMKGVIYYQGESNRHRRNETYRDSFASMINQWRKGWGQDQLYFFWAQLAHWKEPVEEPIEKDEHGWAEICFQQFEVLDQVPDSGMAVLNDIGHNRSIHPPNKMDVGKRLSLWALQAEGKNVIPSGPLYQSARKDGNNVIITFKYAGSGLMTGSKTDLDPTVETQEPLGHFQICGADRQWKWAEAKITGKDTVEVRHPEIANPVEVRYAWAANPAAANLYHKEGLPASVFKAEL